MFAMPHRQKCRTISQNDARKRLASGEKIYLLDVRSTEEYNELHIPHSISLPLDQLKRKISKVVGDPSAEIFVYCHSGMRAETACRELSAMGYKNVWNMGGIMTWCYETERGNG